MTNWTELKRLAESINEGCGLQGADAEEAMFNFECAATPETILALIAENERLSEECEGCPMAYAERLREERDSQQRVCIKVMEERDQLRAEVEALQSIALELRDWVGCADVNHRSGEFHEADEPCKVLARIDSVLKAKP